MVVVKGELFLTVATCLKALHSSLLLLLFVVVVVVAVSYRAQLPCLLCEMRRKTGQNMCLHRSCVYRDELLTHLLRVCC